MHTVQFTFHMPRWQTVANDNPRRYTQTTKYADNQFCEQIFIHHTEDIKFEVILSVSLCHVILSILLFSHFGYHVNKCLFALDISMVV